MAEISTEFSRIRVATAETGPYHLVQLMRSYAAEFASDGTVRIDTFGAAESWVKQGRKTFALSLDGLLELQTTATSTITVGTGGALANATSVPVTALPVALASGTILYFAGSKLARLTAAAASGATSITVSPLAAALNAGETATHQTAGSQNPLRTAYENNSDLWVHVLPEGDGAGSRGWRARGKVTAFDTTSERDGDFIGVTFSFEGGTTTAVTLA